MAFRRFGSLNLQTTDYTWLATTASGYDSTINIRFVNRGANDAMVRLALVDEPQVTALSGLTDDDFLEYDAIIKPGGIIETTGLAVEAEFSLVVKTDTIDISVTAYGVEEQII